VDAAGGDGEGLPKTIESALSQSWPALQVLVANGSRERADPEEVLRAFEGRVDLIGGGGRGGTAALQAAVEASQGKYVAVIGAGTELRRRAVHMGLALPAFKRGVTWLGEDWYEQLDRLLAAAEEILGAVPAGTPMIVVDAGLGRPRTIGPVLEYPKQGGNPADDEHAVEDLESLRKQGARFLAFLWPAFWWLDHYRGLSAHLDSSYRRVLASERVILFDLRG
jgi:hypothetical protein